MITAPRIARCTAKTVLFSVGFVGQDRLGWVILLFHRLQWESLHGIHLLHGMATTPVVGPCGADGWEGGLSQDY